MVTSRHQRGMSQKQCGYFVVHTIAKLLFYLQPIFYLSLTNSNSEIQFCHFRGETLTTVLFFEEPIVLIARNCFHFVRKLFSIIGFLNIALMYVRDMLEKIKYK